ncbi:MAG TPA: hypothetical protein PLA94_19880 [Myxococcota bacterium]|nr:hypothetical protein [Myxococcota bacterium]
MSVWALLAGEHEKLRQRTRTEVSCALQARLQQLVLRRHCARMATHQLTWRKVDENGREELLLRDEKPIQLEKLPDLGTGSLQILALFNARQKRMEKYTVEFTAKKLVIAIHLDEKPMGSGACGHALLHGHIGPDCKTPPKLRVPLPPLAPEEALDWLLSQLLREKGREFEPSPWLGSPVAPAAPPR